jgi:hypothetical protein
MSNFLIGVEYDSGSSAYRACFLDGQTIRLSAATYHDAVLEADMLEPEIHEVGYN